MKNILITGCSSGIGFDAAQHLQKMGWNVLATCRSESDCVRLRALGLTSFTLDYSDSHSIQNAACEALRLTDGKIDALFNNGAFATPGLVEDLPRGALQDIFETNLFGPFELINALLPAMRANGGGHIINCSSVLGLAALRFRGAYCATKFAMEGLTDALRLELRETQTPVQVVLLEPGPITSEIRSNSIAHFERWINVEKSAHAALYKNLLIPRLYRSDNKVDRFELPASAISRKLEKILNTPTPRPRYYATVPTYVTGFLKRMLSSRALDRILASN